MVSGDRAFEVKGRSPILQCLQPSELWASQHGAGWHSRKTFHADWLWSAHIHHLSANRLAGCRVGWGQQSTNDCVSSTVGVLSFHVDRNPGWILPTSSLPTIRKVKYRERVCRC